MGPASSTVLSSAPSAPGRQPAGTVTQSHTTGGIGLSWLGLGLGLGFGFGLGLGLGFGRHRVVLVLEPLAQPLAHELGRAAVLG